MVTPPDAGPGTPASVAFDVVAQCVLRVARLVDGIDAIGAFARWMNRAPSCTQTWLPFTSTTTMPESGIRTTRSASWSLCRSDTRTFAMTTQSSGSCRTARCQVSRSDAVVNVG